MKMFQKKYFMSRTVIAAVIIVFAQLAMAAPPLPREPTLKPTLSGSSQGVARQPVGIGMRPKFDPSNISALPVI